MRTINKNDVFIAVREACISIQNRYSPKMEAAMMAAIDKETGLAKSILQVLMENSNLASSTGLPMCQDTGMIVVWAQLGHQVLLESPLEVIINEAVKEAYEVAYLRKSIVDDPLFNRTNTKDNAPAVVHVEIVEGDKLTLNIAAKGFGSENMSALKMLTPADGVEGVKQFIIETVSNAGPNACPPMVVGVGVGGTMDQAAWLAKRSLFRDVGERNEDSNYSALEEELLTRINDLGIGPQGLGGKTTALDVFIEHFPTHIAGLPVAVNIQCHMTRHHKVVL